jgi:hypothetical protein
MNSRVQDDEACLVTTRGTSCERVDEHVGAWATRETVGDRSESASRTVSVLYPGRLTVE